MDLKSSLIELQCEMVAERNLVNPKEITWLQYDILVQTEKEGQVLPSDLSRLLGIRRTKLSKALKGLKEMGYIEQIPNKLDGRELYTSLTDDGKELVDLISENHDSLYQMALELFTEDEQGQLTYFLDLLVNRLRKARIEANE